MRFRHLVVAAGTPGPLRAPAPPEARDIGRDTLPAGYGWASYGGGTTGGAAADDDHVRTVTDRAGLVRAPDNGSDTPSGTPFHAYPVDLLAIHNAGNHGGERDLMADVGRTPTLHTKIDSAAVADREVARGAGAGRIP